MVPWQSASGPLPGADLTQPGDARRRWHVGLTESRDQPIAHELFLRRAGLPRLHDNEGVAVGAYLVTDQPGRPVPRTGARIQSDELVHLVVQLDCLWGGELEDQQLSHRWALSR